MSQWPKDLIEANFLDVIDRLGLEAEAALDFEFDDDALHPDDLRDLSFGIGYVRGIADAYDCTTLELIDEVTT